jgi:hypothetical protein
MAAEFSGDGVLAGLPAEMPPDGLLRTLSGLLHDFRMEPRVWREDREILLCPRMLPLNEQEATSGDAECVCLVVRDLAARYRGAVQVDLDSHDQPSFARGAVSSICHATPCSSLLSVSSQADASATRGPAVRAVAQSRHT